MPHLSRTYFIPDMIFIALEKQIWYFLCDSSCKIFHAILFVILFQSVTGNTENKKGGKRAGIKKKFKY